MQTQARTVFVWVWIWTKVPESVEKYEIVQGGAAEIAALKENNNFLVVTFGNSQFCRFAFFMALSEMDDVDRPVSIQVGGRTFATRLSTLRRFPDALLWRAYTFNEKHFDLVFWDRNPEVFECILEYYRTGRLPMPPDVDFGTVKGELLFWGFDVCPADRPAWPVLPAPREEVRPAHGGIRCPLGVAWRESSSGCHYVLVGLVWSALGRCAGIWEVAQKGYRSVTIFWKTRAPGVDFSLLKTHLKILHRLAQLDACKVRLLPEVTTAALGAEVRNHDLYTNGHLHASAKSTHVALWKVTASYRKEGHELLLRGAGKQTFSFDHRGFRVTMHLLGENIWWFMDPLSEGHAIENENVDVSMMDGAQGFLLDVLFVVDHTVFPGFTIPSCYYRTSTLRADIFMGSTYMDMSSADDTWYLAPGRHELTYETSPFDFLERQAYAENQELVILFEEKPDPSLVCHPATNIVPYTSSASFSPSSYDRLVIEW